VLPGFGDDAGDDGCWRMANTKVLLTVRR
jgi:hypothetical protein